MAQIQYWGTGRRKKAIARVRLVPGTGKIIVNGREMEEYFNSKILEMVIQQPFKITNTSNKFDVLARVHGGGISGQAGALRLGIARSLVKADSELRPVLKKGGFMTRDPRMKERKKYGLKKARRAPQFSKR